MKRICWSAGYLIALALVGCLPGASSPGGGPADRPPTAGSPKVITIAALNPITAIGAWDTSGGGGTFGLHYFHTSPLITNEFEGKETRLLSRLPSLDDGTIAILPDGRMQTTWNVRPGVKWHDGAMFTSEDLAFTFQVYQDREVGLQLSDPLNNIEGIAAPDPGVAIVTWKNAYYQPLNLNLREFWPLPRHLLATAFAGDKAAFRNLPYWTTEYVNTGPFRLVDFGLGEQVVLERFDDYFLGAPKIDKIVIRILPSSNVVLANIMAGTLDMTSYAVLSKDDGLALDTEWKKTGEGRVAFGSGPFWFQVVQMDPQWARPPEISRDVRIREGLLMGVDREALREAILPGVPDTGTDSFLPDSDPRTSVIGKPFSRYPYDPRAAAQRLEAAGWRRALDGRLLNPAGAPVELEFRNQGPEGPIFAQYWRDLGIQVNEAAVSAALARDLEYSATFPALSGNANNRREGLFQRLVSTAHATAQNHYSGLNTGHYTNLRLDQLFGTLTGTPGEREQLPILRELGEFLATDLPLLPSYYGTVSAAARKGIRGALDDYQGDGMGTLTRNAYRWDVTQ